MIVYIGIRWPRLTSSKNAFNQRKEKHSNTSTMSPRRTKPTWTSWNSTVLLWTRIIQYMFIHVHPLALRTCDSNPSYPSLEKNRSWYSPQTRRNIEYVSWCTIIDKSIHHTCENGKKKEWHLVTSTYQSVLVLRVRCYLFTILTDDRRPQIWTADLDTKQNNMTASFNWQYFVKAVRIDEHTLYLHTWQYCHRNAFSNFSPSCNNLASSHHVLSIDSNRIESSTPTAMTTLLTCILDDQ